MPYLSDERPPGALDSPCGARGQRQVARGALGEPAGGRSLGRGALGEIGRRAIPVGAVAVVVAGLGVAVAAGLGVVVAPGGLKGHGEGVKGAAILLQAGMTR